MATELRSAYFLPAQKTFHNSILTFSSKCDPVISRCANYIHRPGQEATFTRRGGMPTPAPQTSTHKAVTLSPSSTPVSPVENEQRGEHDNLYEVID